MGRWEPGAAERLQSAALELFVEQGFAAVTVPQITARAGLTTRTFFRHFADKREVLFTGEDALPAVMAQVFAEASPTLPPMEVILTSLCDVVAPRFDGLRDHLRLRRSVVLADEGLRERELRKRALIAEAGAAGFRGRGLGDLEASLAAQLAAVIIDTAVSRWLDEPTDRTLTDIIRDTTSAMQTIITTEVHDGPASSNPGPRRGVRRSSSRISASNKSPIDPDLSAAGKQSSLEKRSVTPGRNSTDQDPLRNC